MDCNPSEFLLKQFDYSTPAHPRFQLAKVNLDASA